MFGYFFIEFIDFMLKGKSLLDYTNSFSPNQYKTNLMFAINIENKKKLKYHFFKESSLSIVYCKCCNKYGKLIKEGESIEILKVIDSINKMQEYQKIYNHT